MPQPLAIEIQPFASIYDNTVDFSSQKLSVMSMFTNSVPKQPYNAGHVY